MFTQEQEHRLAWCCFFLMGAGVLAPWNAFITAVDYFAAVFPGRHMDRLFTVCYLPSCLLLLGLTMRYRLMGTRARVLAGFAGFTVLLVAVPLVDAVLVMGKAQAPDGALPAVLLAVVLVGVLDGMCQGAIFGDAASQPVEYTHAVVGGTASSGLLVCLLRMATKAGGGSGEGALRRSTALYFSCSAAITLAGLLAYWLVMPRLSVLNKRRLSGHCSDAADVELSYGLESRDSDSCWPWISGAGNNGRQQHQQQAQQEQQERRLLSAVPDRKTSLEDGLLEAAALEQQQQEREQEQDWAALGPAAAEAAEAAGRAGSAAAAGIEHLSSSHVLGHRSVALDSKATPPAGASLRWLLSKVWQLALSLFLVYAVTLCIFPGFLAEDVHSAELGDWYNIILIFLFNAADLTGKNVPLGPGVRVPRVTLRLAMARFLFLPAFVVAATKGAAPAVMALLTVLLGLSNGYLTAAAMTAAPAGLPARCAEGVENIMVFSLVNGLTAGALLGWLWLL